jgi:Phosphotransferase enzyme family
MDAVEIDSVRVADADLGPELARGRDMVVYESGPGRVLRRAEPGRDLRAEAAIMEYVRAAGYPAPRVFRVGDGELELARVDGPTMVDDLLAHPWRAAAHGRLLARLHRDLHRIPLPSDLPLRSPYGPGTALLHRDLHPANVLLSPAGPVVIDWTNAAAGPAGVDDADTWLLLHAAEIDGPRWRRAAAFPIRRTLLRAYLRAIDLPAARAALPAAAASRLQDRNMRPTEIARMRALAGTASVATP